MSETIKKGQLFIQEVVARIKGDDAEALASKIARKALTSVDSQIAALKSKEVDLENEVEDAEEALKDAKFPTEQISKGQSYIQGIQDAHGVWTTKSEELAELRESIKFFKKLLTEF